MGGGAASQSLLKLEYSYGGAANNGNVVEQKITVPGAAHPFIQTYTYDELNRLASAEETQNTSQTWKQAFAYDRYGNRNFNTSNSNTTTLPPGFAPEIYNPTVSTANNRFASGQGYSYDAAGNTTADPAEGGRTFVYDAENKQISVSDGFGTVGQYYYDGDGKRVKKYVPGTGELTVFVYDAGGKLVGEYSTIVQAGPAAKIVYTTSDHLGSPRINTDGIGQVVSRHDYHPFGEEIARASYGSDTIRKQFTGYERDGETGLDFAQARYFKTASGRFSSPDYFLNDAEVTDPRSWNLYVYVRNNPLKYTDPTGEKIYVRFWDRVGEDELVETTLEYRDGKLFTSDGEEYTGSNEYAMQALADITLLSKDPVLGLMIDQLVSSKKSHKIQMNLDDTSNNSVVENEDGTTVFWSGKSTTYDGPRGPVAASVYSLAHELLGHAWSKDRGRERAGNVEFRAIDQLGNPALVILGSNSEIDAIDIENRARFLLGDFNYRTSLAGVDISELLKFPGGPLQPTKPPTLLLSPRPRRPL